METVPLRTLAARVAQSRISTNVAYGAELVTEPLLTAIHRFAGFSAIDLLVTRADVPRAKAIAQMMEENANATEVRVRLLSDLSRGAAAMRDWDVWHESRPQGDCRRAFHLRELSTRAFPVTLTHHSLAYASYLHDFFLPLLMAPSRSCDAVICTSQASRTAIRHLLDRTAEGIKSRLGVELAFRGELPVIPLGVDIARFRPRDRGQVRKQLGLPIDEFILLWLGRVSTLDKADLSPLLRVVARLASANPLTRISLLVAGTSFDNTGKVLLSFARALGIGDRVRVIEAIDHRDAHLWYAAADAFVSPVDNVNETFGLTPIEAMACGLPQIVSDWDGYRDTVVDGETGFLIPTWWNGGDESLEHEAEILGDSWEPGLKLAQVMAVDLNALEERVQLLLNDRGLRERMSVASRQRAVKRYSWASVAQEHALLWHHLRQVASRDRRPPDVCTYLRPEYTRCFGHYSTRRLTEASTMQLTREGEMFAAGANAPPFHPFLANFIEPAVVRAILEQVRDGVGVLDGKVTVRDVLAGHPRGKSDRRIVQQHVLWMAKHGLARLEP